MTECIKPWPSQLELSTVGEKILKEHMLVYLAMEERTGKSLTAILIAEECINVRKVLIITKKAAVGMPVSEEPGWLQLIASYTKALCTYEVVNYHSASKAKGDHDLVILDEPHAYISGYPKPSKLWKEVAKLCKDKPIIYLSATPYAQGIQLLYHQLKLCTWSTWAQYKDFYAWFKTFAKLDKNGNFKTIYIGPGRAAIDYKAVDTEKALATVKHLFITKTRAELGFKQEPGDVLHYIELSDPIKEVYNTLLRDKILPFHSNETGKDYTLVCDTPMKYRTALHMIEGGGLKVDEEYIVLGNTEKVDYILEKWGDNEDVVIMYQYIAEGMKLPRHFKKARLLQAQRYAEGVDLSMYKHLIIYSQNFSTAQHTQRRARQANKERIEDIKVHYLLVKKAVSEQAYQTVSVNKTNFVDSVFEREEL